MRLAGTPRGTACKRWDTGSGAALRCVGEAEHGAPRGAGGTRAARPPDDPRPPPSLPVTHPSLWKVFRSRPSQLSASSQGRTWNPGGQAWASLPPGPRHGQVQAPDGEGSSRRGARWRLGAVSSQRTRTGPRGRPREQHSGVGIAVEETGEDRFTCAEISQMTEGDGVKTGTKQRQVRTPSRNERHWEISLATTRRQVPTPNPARPRPLIFQDKPREGAMTLDLRGEAARGQQRRTETPARRRRVL